MNRFALAVLLAAVSAWGCREATTAPVSIADNDDGQAVDGDGLHANDGNSDGDGYRDGDDGDAPSGDGSECVSHNRQRCDGNDVYWFDSCDTRQELVHDCGVDGYSADYCASDDVYRDREERSCVAAACESLATPELVEDCGVDGYSANYCSSNDVYRDHVERSCTAAACDALRTPELVEDCGADGYSANYCSSNDVYRDRVERSCAAAACESSETPELVEDCGADGYSANYCSSGKLYRDQIDRSCAAGACDSSSTQQLVEDCDCSCSGSSCRNRVASYKYGNNGGVTCDEYCSDPDWDSRGPRGDCLHAWETGVEVQRDCQHTLSYSGGHLLCWCLCFCGFC